MPQTPPPVYSEVDDAQLHIRIAALNLDGVPLSPSRSAASGTPRYSNASAVVSRPPPPPPVLYTQSTPGSTVLATSWAEAADETQGVSGASPQRVTPKRKKKKPSGAYAVFCGLQTGPFLDWADVQALVIGVPNNVYKGYRNFPIAEAAYLYAHQRGWTRVISRSSRDLPTTLGPALRALPAPDPDPSNPLHDDSDGRWYVVYKGINPGVYSSSLECSLNTRGLSCATYDSWDDLDIANSFFQQAVADGRLITRTIVLRTATGQSPACLAKSAIHRVAAFELDVTGGRHLHSEALSLTVMSSTQLECPAPLTHFQVISKGQRNAPRHAPAWPGAPAVTDYVCTLIALLEVPAAYKGAPPGAAGALQSPRSRRACTLQSESPVQAAFPRQHDDFVRLISLSSA
ncbi:hypothetical protein DFH06DRAFT_1351784 [Mycena polygramma]|nr:hypothetical protein DFH06DRAFT_1351784 [Mycena polygramma]